MPPYRINGKEYSLEPHPEFGFLRVNPTPSPEEITKFYAEEFYSTEYKRCNDSSLEVLQEDLEFYQGHYQDLCDGIAAVEDGPVADRAVLDVGCGWAQALIYFKKQGMIAHGFDPAPEAVEYARRQGLNVVQAGMDRMSVFEGQRFDVVTLLNVLEHLADPVAVLREIHEEVLKPRGVIVIDVPNEFNPFQLAGRDVHGLEDWWVAPPAHLNYFQRESLCRVLEGGGQGFVALALE